MDEHEQQAADVGKFFTCFSEKWSAIYNKERHLILRWFDYAFRGDIYRRYDLTFRTLGKDLRNKSVLEIGCGDGTYTFEASRRSPSLVVGVDVSEKMIKRCMHHKEELRLGDNIKFIQTWFPSRKPIIADGKKFHIAIVMGVMDYVVDPVSFLTAVREHVTEYALISFPGMDLLRWNFRRWRYKLLKRCSVFHYHEAEVRTYCEKAGFMRLEITRLNQSGVCYFVKAYA